jgi:hypothetical protein
MVRFIVPWACQYNEPTCLAAASDNFNLITSTTQDWNDLNINYRDYSKNYGIRNGGESEIRFIYFQAKEASDQSEKNDYIRG